MPIDDAINVRKQILELTGEQFRGFHLYKRGRDLSMWVRERNWDDGTEGTELRWLDEIAKQSVYDILDAYVDWGELKPEEIAIVKENVNDHMDSPAQWFKGVSLSPVTEARLAAKNAPDLSEPSRKIER